MTGVKNDNRIAFLGETQLMLEQPKKRKNIEELFSNFDGEYISAEVDFGETVGNEVW